MSTVPEVTDFGSFGASFFIYDESALVKEEDKVEDAVRFYHPKEQFSLLKVRERCAQIIGFVSAIGSLSGSRPNVLCLKQEKFALVYEKKYGLVLAGRLTEADEPLRQRIKRLYDLFVFYHGSLGNVFKQMKGNDQAFADRLDFIWRHYYREEKSGSKTMRSVFLNALEFVELPKHGRQYFLRASQILQSSQRQEGIFAGCVIYKKDVLCSQLTPELTAKILAFAKKTASHRPAHPINTGLATLPNFINLYPIYLQPNEYDYLVQLRRQSGNASKTLSTQIPLIVDTPSASPSPVPVCSSFVTLERSNPTVSSATSSRNSSPATPRSSRLITPSPKTTHKSPFLNHQINHVTTPIRRQLLPETEAKVKVAAATTNEKISNGVIPSSGLKVPMKTPYRLSPISPSKTSDVSSSSLPSSPTAKEEEEAAVATLAESVSFVSLTSGNDHSQSQSSESIYIDCRPVVDSPNSQLDGVAVAPKSPPNVSGTNSSWVSGDESKGVIIIDDDADEEKDTPRPVRSRSGAFSLVEDVDAVMEKTKREPQPKPSPPPLPDFKVDGLTSAVLYIQAPEQSNLVLAMLADETLIYNEATLRCLWEGSLPQLADLQVEIGNCLDAVKHPDHVSHFLYASYNGYECTLETNVFVSSKPTRSPMNFIKNAKVVHNTFLGDSSVSDVTLKTFSNSQIYGRRSLHREVYFQAHKSKMTNTSSASLDARETKNASSHFLGLETTARSQLADDLGYAIF